MLSSCSSVKGEYPLTSCSPYSTMRRLKVQRATRSILAISVQGRPNERRLTSMSSGISSLGLPLSPFLSTVGPTSEYRARSVHLELIWTASRQSVSGVPHNVSLSSRTSSIAPKISSQSETSYSSVRSPASAILITKARALGTRSFYMYITWCAQDTMRRNC